MTTIISIIIAYLLGSLSSSIIICKLTHQPDPRTLGSGNPGATNMLRFAGKKLAIMTLIGDLLKGTVAVSIGRLLFIPELSLGFVALAVFIGHLYPIYFKFKGGKGVATGLGVLLGLSPLLALATAVTWGIVAAIFRYSSLAALVAAGLTPVFALFLTKLEYWPGILAIVILLIWRHRKNIIRLRACEEGKIGDKT